MPNVRMCKALKELVQPLMRNSFLHLLLEGNDKYLLIEATVPRRCSLVAMAGDLGIRFRFCVLPELPSVTVGCDACR